MMKVPQLDLKAQYDSIRDQVSVAIDGVMSSQKFILGEEVSSLEKELASMKSSDLQSESIGNINFYLQTMGNIELLRFRK